MGYSFLVLITAVVDIVWYGLGEDSRLWAILVGTRIKPRSCPTTKAVGLGYNVTIGINGLRDAPGVFICHGYSLQDPD
jgi:hypothetical protein